MQSAEIFKEIANSALVGTERKPFSPLVAEGKLGEALAKINPADPQKALLTAAGILVLYNTAGKLPPTDNSALPLPCDLDDLPVIRPTSEQHLLSMLSGKNPELLLEWLEAAANKGKRVTATCLTQLLDYGKHSVGFRQSILPVLGKRGLWLAKQNPDWLWATGAEDALDWETAGRQERLIYLARLRKKDAAKARELLQATWKQEKAADRAALLKTFEANLSAEDEPFLETALNDRSSEVSKVAGGFLANLVDSAFCQRNLERVAPMVRLNAGDTLALGLSVIGALEKNKEFLRDRIEMTHFWYFDEESNHKISHYEEIFIELVSAVPLGKWSELFGRTAEELLLAAYKGEYYYPLVVGWLRATHRFADLVWARAILDYCLFGLGENKSLSGAFLTEIINLLALLPPNEQLAYVSTLLDQKRLPDARLSELLGVMSRSWSVEFSRKVLNYVLENIILANQNNNFYLTGIFAAILPKIPPAFVKEAVTILPIMKRNEMTVSEVVNAAFRYRYDKEVSNFVSKAEFRHEMLKEINA